ncbi:hypothetical protein GOV13_00100 [Candidatus Pacearchaeota archaeon]|nr:hypothetical protein [Candidatus Pacearchaeota archaeon]
MGFLDFIRSIFIKKSKRIPKKRKVRRKTYGLLKFKYNRSIKLRRTTQQRAIRDYNRYIRNFVRAHKRNLNRYELGRIVRGASHVTIEYRKSKTGHWPRQWLRKYIYGLHGIRYTMR